MIEKAGRQTDTGSRLGKRLRMTSEQPKPIQNQGDGLTLKEELPIALETDTDLLQNKTSNSGSNIDNSPTNGEDGWPRASPGALQDSPRPKIVAIDTETTGLEEDGGRNELMQLGMICDDGRTFKRFFQPCTEVTPQALKVHGIDSERLIKEKAKAFSKTDAQQVSDFIGDAKVVAHNFAFDRNVLFRACRAVGTRMTSMSKWVCTQSLARSLQLPSSTLKELATHMEVAFEV